METKIKALIVDDEILARDVIRNFLSAYEQIDIIGESTSGVEALQAIREKDPDLVFLDIQMPDLNGLQLLRALDEDTHCSFIFVTAHNSYAIDAFDANAIDYLLKPFTRERFNKAMVKAFAHLNSNNHPNGMLDKLLKAYSQIYNNKVEYIKKILVKESKKIFLVSLNEVYFMEASADYVRLHLKNRSHLINDSLNNLEQQLDSRQFVRIHRSYIVNVDMIKEFIPHFNGEYVIVMENGSNVKLSRSYKEKFKEIIGKKL